MINNYWNAVSNRYPILHQPTDFAKRSDHYRAHCVKWYARMGHPALYDNLEEHEWNRIKRSLE